MSRPRGAGGIALFARFATLVLFAMLPFLAACGAPEVSRPSDAPPRMRLAVLGNSDSHAYHDSAYFPPGSPERGGAERAVTFQWTELLQRLRGDSVDQGAWGLRGGTARRARVAGMIGITMRTPRKQDFAYNLAFSGARCSDLSGPRGQLAQLLHTIDEAPDAWKGGVVVVRIGINDLGTREVIEQVLRTGYGEAQRTLARSCTDTIIASARVLLARQPALRIALVGILDNTNWPPNFDLRLDSAGASAVRQTLDDYDNALRTFAAATPGVAFIDDRAWWAETWGTRGPASEMAAKTVERAGLRVTLTQGDPLTNAFVADGHAGTVFNALWLQRLVAELNAKLGTTIAPITDAEIDTVLRALSTR